MDIIKDIRSLTEFKRDTARLVSHLKNTGRPCILTVNGKPALVVMEAEAWQDMQDQTEYARTTIGIRKGLDQARKDQGCEAGAFFKTLSSPTEV